MPNNEPVDAKSDLTIPGIITLTLYCILFITILGSFKLPQFMVVLLFTIPIFNLFAGWTFAKEIGEVEDKMTILAFFNLSFWLMLLSVILLMLSAGDDVDVASLYVYRIGGFGLPCVALYYNIQKFHKGVLRSIIFTLAQAWALLLVIFLIMGIFGKSR